MFRTALTVAQLPAKATRNALKTATSPNAINALSLAIAQASIQTADQDEVIQIEGLNVEIFYNQERLLTTAGISTALALGTVYWIGEKLKIQFRYSAMISALEELRRFIALGDTQKATNTLNLIDTLSNPLIDPETLKGS